MGNSLSKSVAASLMTAAAAPRKKLALVAAVAVAVSAFSLRPRKSAHKRSRSSERRKKRASRRKVTGAVLHVLRYGMGVKEWSLVVALTTSLLLRTYLSLWIARNMGESIGYFCNQQFDKVALSIFSFGRNTVGAAVVNAALKYFTSLLSLSLRQTLTQHTHKLYMQNMNYYGTNHVGDNKFENADQLICDDIAKFSEAFADVYSQSLKPIVDFVLFSWKLGECMGLEGPLGMYTWFFVAVAISAKVLPSYGRLAAKRQQLEGRFRARHAKLIQNAEMVAFMRGEVPERRVLDTAYQGLKKHMKHTLRLKFYADVVQGYVNKYFASVVGFSLTARPVLVNYNGMGSWSPGEIAKYYVESRQIMESLANAVLALFELQKRVGTLSGLAARVSNLLSGLHHREPPLQDVIAENTLAGRAPAVKENSEVLRFIDVDVHKPDGVLLLRSLNIEVQPGQRVMVTGDNGCGKSSLFRVICGLWPLCSGTLERPLASDVYFLSQVNFVPVGSLREIIIYPQTVESFYGAGGSDEELTKILRWAHLENFKCDNMHPTLDTVLEWETALSPGQKQRMAFCRLFFSNPRFAVLDECTNGIAPDIEADLYERLRTLGMAVFSISHKNELKRYHDFELHFHANEAAGWDWIDLRDI